MEDSLQKDHPWNNLRMVTTFDKGSKSSSTRFLAGNGKSKENKEIIRKVSPSTILIGTLIKQLCLMLEKDPAHSKRLYLLLCDTMLNLKLIDPSYKLYEFDIIQEKYMTAVCNLINVARSTIINSDNQKSIPRPLTTYVSPYQDQFREIGFIAGGGFGNVFKAVHKLDEVEYAIKKIVVKPGRVRTIMNHLEEVRTIAKLNHNNIVPYKQAWIEPMSGFYVPEFPLTSESNSSNELYKNRISCSIKNSFNEQKSHSKTSGESKKSCEFLDESQIITVDSDKLIVDECMRSHDASSSHSSDIISFRDETNDKNAEEISSRSSTEESITSDESSEDNQVCHYSTRSNQLAILYIQMALCEKTLRQWLDERTEPTPTSMVAAITTQILNGLDYIHSLNIVHHDIKPSNIFISTSGKLQVQLGDFGLACPLQRESHDVVGTCMYAAPEQLKGECNPKSDIYSLGIVLLELLIPMQTSMECIKMVETVKTGKIPPTLAAPYPKWAKIISQLIEINPTKRPSTIDLLEDLKIDKDLIIAKLENENNILQHENKKKDQIIEDQNILIQSLQAMLTKLQS